MAHRKFFIFIITGLLKAAKTFYVDPSGKINFAPFTIFFSLLNPTLAPNWLSIIIAVEVENCFEN